MNGTAETIVDAVIKLCTDLDLNMINRLCVLGIDGASMILVGNNGVFKLLKVHVPFLLSNHGIAHRLAVACGQAANEIRFFK